MSRKNSTKEKKTNVKEKKNRRQKEKWPALNRAFNLRLRQDYIEPDYVNGVKNEAGELVIRSLTDEEKTFLNNWYEESIGANFLHDDDLRSLNKNIQQLKKRIKEDPDPSLEDQELLDYYSLLLYDRREDILIYPDEEDHKRIYGDNNARNRCLFNRAKASGSFIDLDTERFNEREESNDYIDPDTGRNILFDNQELFDKYEPDED